MAKKLYSAIVFFKDNIQPVRKYHNISSINNFINFARSLDAEYFNLYEKTTRLYVERIYIKKGVRYSPLTFILYAKPTYDKNSCFSAILRFFKPLLTFPPAYTHLSNCLATMSLFCPSLSNLSRVLLAKASSPTL